MQRLESLAQQLDLNRTSSGVSKITEKHPDDVVIIAAYRTPLTKAGKGKQKDTPTGVLLKELFAAVVEKSGVDPKLIGDISTGNVCNVGAGANEHRAAALAAGIPYTAGFMAINRQCSSGLMAVNDIANKITTGQIDCGIGAGAESMSLNYGPQLAQPFHPSLMNNQEAAKCLIPMGITSENVAEKYGISRAEQDAFAAASFQKAEKAQAAGLFKEEIIPIKTTVLDADDNEHEVIVTEDDGIRKGVTAESLAKIRPAFKKTGSTHAGNASQVTDGAGAVLLARRSFAEKNKLPIVGKFVDCRVVGVPPEIMGIGPAVAIPEVLKAVGITVDDVDIYEINEAFASQALYSIKAVGIDINKVNPKGGAIALGHPLGATGARQVSTLLTELKRTGKKIGVTSMCIGSGMGAASVIVRE